MPRRSPSHRTTRHGRSARTIGTLLAAVMIASGCGGADGDDGVTVFVAASLGDVTATIAEAFSAETETAVRVNVAGSSALRLQLDEGAAADVFIPADPAQLALLERAVEPAADPLASNRLVIAVPVDGADVTLADFADDELLLGACAPQVPCGRYAATAFDAAGVTPALDTEETDVRSLASKIADGALDAGLVYVTDVRADERLREIALPAAVDDQIEIEYLAALVSDTERPELAATFIEFLGGPTARTILTDAGFGT